MKIDILTLFPEMFKGPFASSIVKRAQDSQLVTITLHNFRDFAHDKHQSVDDKPYGGGAGMVIRVDVLVEALETILNHSLPSKDTNEKIYVLSAKGELFTQHMAQSFANENHVVLIAGHYEGVDERIMEFIDGEISIGKYVLTGGEIPAMVVVDAITRLLPGAITQASIVDESFSKDNTLEYPQYTRPETFRGIRVPEQLVSGDHKAIATWRNEKRKYRG